MAEGNHMFDEVADSHGKYDSSFSSRTADPQTLRHRLTDAIIVKSSPDAYYRTSLLVGPDIAPLPLSRRTWGPWTFVAYWLSTAINLGQWGAASALFSLGLNVWQAIICVVLGNLILALALVLAGLPGAEWHIPFAVIARGSWGTLGAYFPLIIRIILAIIFFGENLVFGGYMLRICIGAIWPSFYTLRNTLPDNAGITTSQLIAVIVFFVLSLPAILIRPERYKIPFAVATIGVTLSSFSLLIWALAKQGGGGPLLSRPSELSGASEVPTGSELVWTMVYGISSTVGGAASAALNQSDFARYARKPRDQIASQLFAVPFTAIITSVIGLIVTSAAAGFYPDRPLLWLPYDLLEAVQDESGGSSGARAACFFAAVPWVIIQMSLNTASNAITAGIDLSGLLPTVFTIRRGAFLVACVGLAYNPWRLLNLPNTFILVLSSFSVFLAPITGVLIADYIVVRRRHLRLTHLFTPGNASIYWFTSGFNFRAFVAFAFGCGFLMPGFVMAVKPTFMVAIGWYRLYEMAWPLGFSIAFVTHVTLSKVVPVRDAYGEDDEDVFGTFSPIMRDEERKAAEEQRSNSDLSDGSAHASSSQKEAAPQEYMGPQT
ncbi:uncharacterized protein L969DRAFT_18861 [Mixia osmundae IAM 14324]|uniref:Uncharacterized protein n=1 Tax=Mixia osmundae (strain CBS 9802 / IAM 14324 / JCM 22182 / KY 12970) TaxID=764103 RepID=G7DX17_MIXOS|nr:uncharacterized protein L969DRAFT_18861 [Mixia osmundae IAM 14324]KEI38077.1 hypothetical protein L969DRAFT_18861 [Mixia osmundae IAM 14324]GAA95114.1 hypothetical protein E5Q_01769 [Mixia osmundae IAM 14324]